MSCENCSEVQDRGDTAYVRVGNANVGIIGCDIHAGHVIRAVNAIRAADEVMLTERVVVRVKGNEKQMCGHCGGDIDVRNPSGFCDHLHYPENCNVCKKSV